MKVLFATTNPAKVRKYKQALEEKGIELITIKDLDFKLNIEENGKELTDDEMIEYYTNLVKEYGGKLTAKWVYGMVICNNNGTEKYSWTKDHFYFVDKPCEKRNQGYPLDSISIVPEFNKYLVDITEEDKKQYKKKDNIDNVIEFITNNIQK